MSTWLRNSLHSTVRKLHDQGPYQIRVEDFAQRIREEGYAGSTEDILSRILDSNKRKNLLTAYGSTKTETRHFVIPVTERLFQKCEDYTMWPFQEDIARQFIPGMGAGGAPVAGFVIPPDGANSAFVQAKLCHTGKTHEGVARSYRRDISRAKAAGLISPNEARVRRAQALERTGAIWVRDAETKRLAGSD